ncbi:MAG: MFS transporter, partial [Streptococcus sp.]
MNWRKNLYIAWIGCFFIGASLSLVVPFMALFVEELGVTGKAVPLYAGIAVASSSVTSAIMSPIWGSLADRYGRKPMMLRASIAMTLTMGGIAFVPSVFWLLVLRLLNGVFSGFVPNST